MAPPAHVEIKKPVDTRTGLETLSEADDWSGDAVNIHIEKVANVTAGAVIADKKWQDKKKKAADEANKKAATSF
jgi:hypothetical protein